MKTKQMVAVIALTISALIFGACGNNANNANGNANANANANSNANSNTNKAAANSEETSPLAAFKTLYEAVQKKDVENIRKGLSNATLVMAADLAAKQNKSTDETIKEFLTDPDNNSPTVPEARNEKINGDEATIEVKAPSTGKWTELPFVKEDGRWKLAYDKLDKSAVASTETQGGGKPPAPTEGGGKPAASGTKKP
jgi:hypothetical protein